MRSVLLDVANRDLEGKLAPALEGVWVRPGGFESDHGPVAPWTWIVFFKPT